MSRAVPIRVAVVNLTPLGVRVANGVAANEGMRLAGLADPLRAGKTGGELGVAAAAEMAVIEDVERLDAIDVAIVCAGPAFDRLAPTIRQLLRGKAHVVSNCEEMAWPWLRHPHLSDVLATEARTAGAVLLGTGEDGGATLATVPLTLATGVSGVTAVRVRRAVDVTSVTADVRRQAGLGVTVPQFRDLLRNERVGRLGVGEAVVLVAQGLGRHPMRGDVAMRHEPVLQDGRVAGLVVSGRMEFGGLVVEAELAIGTGTGHHVEVTGGTTLRADLDGTADVAASLVHAAMGTATLKPGVRTVLDLPLVSRSVEG